LSDQILKYKVCIQGTTELNRAFTNVSVVARRKLIVRGSVFGRIVYRDDVFFQDSAAHATLAVSVLKVLYVLIQSHMVNL
jgi:hypothetical protein